MKIIEGLNAILWGQWMIILILGAGIYLSFKTGFIQIKKFVYMLRHTILSLFKKNKNKKSTGVTPFQAVTTALAGTIGTGSIAGIATAITLGGPGAVFWMWVSAFFAMATKYAEIVLSVKFQQKSSDGERIGGPMFYIEKGTGKRAAAVLFSVFAIIGSFGIGNTVQSNAISQILMKEGGISPWITATLLAVVMAVVVLGGISAIAKVNEKLVPMMAVFYIFCTLAVLFVNRERIPAAFNLIFTEAFSVRAGSGYLAANAIRYGFSRGIFSNEAGLGSAPIAHGASDAAHPAEQGLWGMFEVFFTTIVICTLTSLVVITSNMWQDAYSGAVLSTQAFQGAIGTLGRVGVSASTVLFALSSIFGWAYYGEVCVEYIFKRPQRAVGCYRVVYTSTVFSGSIARL